MCNVPERFHCLAVWNEDDYHFVVFGSPSSQSSRYVLVRATHTHCSAAFVLLFIIS